MLVSNGFFVQSRFGAKGDFEVVVPKFHGQLQHLSRDNDQASLPWSQRASFGTGDFTGASLIQSNFGSGGFGNFEVAAIQSNQVLHFWRPDTPPFSWDGPLPIGTGVSGNPALIQSRFGERGNFEVVTPMVAGGLGHWWRDNDTPGLPWHGPTLFGQSLGQVQGTALIQSDYGNPGNLEVVAAVGSSSSASLVHFWRDKSGWHGPNPVPLPGGTAPIGEPGLIQTKDGDFLVVVSHGHTMTQIRRHNSDPILPWVVDSDFPTFPVPDLYIQVSLVQSIYGPADTGNIEAVIRSTGAGPDVLQAHHFWREGAPGSPWHGPNQLPTM
jgi:hypothetical protein